MGESFVALPPVGVIAVGLAYFAMLYFATGGLTWWLSRHALPALGYGRLLDPRPVSRAQLRREVGESLMSIAIFGIGLLLPWWLLQADWARLALDPSCLRVAGEIGVLFLWNEVHFYISHRLLHTRALRRFHASHHHSHVATPFSTYALHPVEALMLGSVPLVPMLLHDFSFVALAMLPVMSIVLNNLGHSNYEFSARAPARGWRAASRRHHLHHACYHGNYGFLLDVFDRVGGSALPLDAADSRIARRDAHT